MVWRQYICLVQNQVATSVGNQAFIVLKNRLTKKCNLFQSIQCLVIRHVWLATLEIKISIKQLNCIYIIKKGNFFWKYLLVGQSSQLINFLVTTVIRMQLVYNPFKAQGYTQHSSPDHAIFQATTRVQNLCCYRCNFRVQDL